MAKSLSKGYTSEESSVTLPVELLAFDTNFRVKASNPGEVVLTNVTTPVDRPEKVRFAYSEIADIYKNTGIDESVTAASKKGVQVLAQVTETWSLTDSDDASYRVDLPVSAHLVLKIPACEHIGINDVKSLVGRVLGSLYDDKAGDWNIASLVRGALVPSGL